MGFTSVERSRFDEPLPNRLQDWRSQKSLPHKPKEVKGFLISSYDFDSFVYFGVFIFTLRNNPFKLLDLVFYPL